MSPVLACRIVTVYTFQGDRSRAFTDAYNKAMDNDRKRGIGGPSIETCLLYAGHSGVSIDQRKTIYGFNPDPPKSRRISDVMDDLAAGYTAAGGSVNACKEHDHGNPNDYSVRGPAREACHAIPANI